MALRPRSTPTPVTPPSNLPVGTYEFTDWSVEITQDLIRDLKRLENLAIDDHQKNKSRSAEEHYRDRLYRILNDKSLRHPYGEIENPPMPSTVEPPTPTRSSAANVYVHSEYNALIQRVDSLNELTRQLMQMHRNEVAETRALTKEFRSSIRDIKSNLSSLRGEVDSLRGEVDTLRGEVDSLRKEIDQMRRGATAQQVETGKVEEARKS